MTELITATPRCSAIYSAFPTARAPHRWVRIRRPTAPPASIRASIHPPSNGGHPGSARSSQRDAAIHLLALSESDLAGIYRSLEPCRPGRVTLRVTTPQILNALNTIARGPLADEELAVAWMRMMGAESVDYHRETIIERGDDHRGAALDYYASRGETPLAWGGSGAASLGLFGAVDNPSYDALYGPGGATDPASGERLVSAKRPGMELVISAHKSVAELGVLGRAEDMHAIMDAERDATLAYLDELTKERGGRRGVAAVATETTGLVYATARHATTRAGDPGPHDHVLIANVIQMKDERGGTKAPDTTLWREHLHAATMVGRLASAKVAVDLGYGIEADGGPTGKLGHWKIKGIPDAALAVHSKRSAEINQAVSDRGFSTYGARAVAARETRKQKRHSAVDDLVPMWRGELDAAGFAPRQLEADIERAGLEYQRSRPRASRVGSCPPSPPTCWVPRARCRRARCSRAAT